MTPAQIAALTAVAGIIEKLGNWQIGSIIALVAFLPDLIFITIILYVVNSLAKAQAAFHQEFSRRELEHREEIKAFVQKYDNNVELVKQVSKLAEGLQDIVVYNSQAMQGVKDSVDNNLFCPLVRKDPKVEVKI